MARYVAQAHDHVFEYDDKGGERSLPDRGDCCIHCGVTWLAFSVSPQKCAPRPKLTPKAEVAPEAKPEAKESNLLVVNGHEWPRGPNEVPNVGTGCLRCGISYGTPDAVWTCTGVMKEIVKIEKRDLPTDDPAKTLTGTRLAPRSITDDEAWVQFAAAGIAAKDVQPEVEADRMLTEFRKRFP